MIIKGSSRAAPSQLANHLRRADTNERVEVLELQSPHDDLGAALKDWQFLASGTKGTKGLYHANIDPAEAYAMTRVQWARSVEVLEEELGLQGQPRAVVLHEKHGRQHIHVVWARTDVATMKLRSDSHNYQAHERASHRLELEFGHEHVPGKHEKRDRDRQQEPPRSEVTHAEWQQAERTGIDPRDRKSHITSLFEQSDSGQAFMAALEEAGYTVAKGDRRDFVLVDEQGEVHSLGRQLRGVKAPALRAFMADIDREALPTATEAKSRQEQVPPRLPEAPAAPEGDDHPAPIVEDDGAAQLQAALADRYAQEREALESRHAAENEQAEAQAEEAAAQGLAEIEAEQERAPAQASASLVSRLWQRIRESFSADARRARQAEEARRAAARKAERERARRTFLANEARRREAQREARRARQEEELRQLAETQAADHARRLADLERANDMARALAEDQVRRQRAAEQAMTERGPPGAR